MHGHGRRAQLVIASCLLAALAVSLFSGYEAPTERWAGAFALTPLCLLRHFDPSLRDLRSACRFAGAFGLSFGYFRVFLITCLLESPFYWFAAAPWPPRSRLALLLGGNLLTHPAVYFFLPCLIKNYLACALVSEAFAAGAEALLAAWLLSRDPSGRPWRSAALVVLANLVSWQIGFLV